MSVSSEVFKTYESIVTLPVSLERVKRPSEIILDSCVKLRFGMLNKDKIELLSGEINNFDLNEKQVSNNIPKIRFLKMSYNKGNTVLSRNNYNTLKGYVTNFIELFDSLIKHCEAFAEEQGTTEDYLNVELNNFIGLEFENIIGDRNLIIRKKLSDLWDVARFIHNKFKKEISKNIELLIKNIESNKSVDKILAELIKDFSIKKPFSLTNLKYPAEKLLRPQSNLDFLIGFYAIIDGTDFNLPKDMISLKRLCQKMLTVNDRAELLRLAELLKKESGIFREVLKERSISDNEELIDNWLDMLTNKLKQGFKTEEIASIEIYSHQIFSRAVRREDLVIAKNLNDAYLALQHYFKRMHEIIKDKQTIINPLQKEWKEMKEELLRIISRCKKIKEFKENWEKIKNSWKKALEKYEKLPIKEIIKSELTFEYYIHKIFYEIADLWILVENNILGQYLLKVVPAQAKILTFTSPGINYSTITDWSKPEIIDNNWKEYNNLRGEMTDLIKGYKQELQEKLETAQKQIIQENTFEWTEKPEESEFSDLDKNFIKTLKETPMEKDEIEKDIKVYEEEVKDFEKELENIKNNPELEKNKEENEYQLKLRQEILKTLKEKL